MSDSPFNPADYGIDLANPVESLVKGHEALLALVKTINESGATLADAEKKVRENASRTGLGASLSAELRQIIFADETAADMNIGDWLYLADQLKFLTTDVRNFADYLVTEAARQNRPAVPADVTTKKAHADQLKSVLEGLFSYVHPMGAVPESFPTKKNKDGKIVPDLVRLPNLSANTGNVGRGAKVRSLRFVIDGESVPAGTLFDEICHRHLSDANGRVNPKQVRTDLGDAFWQGWTMTLNGHNVECIVPVGGVDKAVDESSDDDESSSSE